MIIGLKSGNGKNWTDTRVEREKVTAYQEWVQMFLVVNSIQEDKKVPVLLSVISGKTYVLLSSQLAPGKPKDKSFEELSEVL